MKVVLIRVMIEKKVINITLKSEISQLFLDNFLFINDSNILGWREYNKTYEFTLILFESNNG